MKLGKILVPVLVFLTFVGNSLNAQTIDTPSLKRKQEDQLRARNMARDLITSILDLQLKQLEENRLEEMQIYRDIKTMKGSLNNLIDSQMEKVVGLLVEAQEGNKTESEAKFIEARQLIRTIVIRLSVERQNLLRRLKTAEILEQAKRLIQLQLAALEATKSLPSEPQARREQLAIKTIEDQRDVKQLFLHLVETLSDVQTWGGTLADGAADGLRILKAAEVGKHLDQAGANLAATQYLNTVLEQAEVIRGLKMLLGIVERTHGLVDPQRNTALAKVRDLVKQQQKLREQVKKTELTSPVPEKLVEQQAQIRKELNNLESSLPKTPVAETHLDQAKAAAEEATADIFEAKQEQAIGEQTKVLGHLAALENMMQKAGGLTANDKSAAEYAKIVKDLEAVKQELTETSKKQQAVSKTAAEKPTESAAKEAEVAEELAKASNNRDLPETVKARIAEAEKAANDAAEMLKQKGQQDKQAAKQAVASAEDAIERALSEVEVALIEKKRKGAAVKIGELARAAETLERVAAAERQIADDASEAAKKSGLETEEAKELAKQQDDIDIITGKIAEGVKETAPSASEMLAQAMKNTKAAADNLEAAKNSPPGPAAKQAAQQVAKNANDASKKLTETAEELRKQIGETARQLAKMSGEQLEQLAKARKAVEDALAKSPESTEARIKQLEEAREKIEQAKADQQKATGRPQAAEGMELAKKVAEAVAKQAAAEQAAQDHSEGMSETPLDAVTKQQQVADALREVAKAAENREKAADAKKENKPDPLAEALKKAEQAAAEAARNTLDGKIAQAESAREQARKALEAAMRAAMAEAQKAAEAPPTAQPDALAQKQVADAVTNAVELAKVDAPDVGKILEKAQQAAEQAQKQMKADEKEATTEAQKSVEKTLEKAGEQLDLAIEKLKEQEAQQLAKQAEQAAELAKEVAKVDRDATKSLRAAEQAAKDGVKSPEKAEQAHEEVQKDLERSAANLAAREEQTATDKIIAEAIAELAKRQQVAAKEITKKRDELEELAKANEKKPDDVKEADKPDPAKSNESENDEAQEKPEPTKEQKAAADALAKAAREFAKGQRATGQGAAEVSQQKEIANKPIREALELASNLPIGDKPTPPEDETEPDDKGDDKNSADKESPKDADKSDKPKNENPDKGKPADDTPADKKPTDVNPKDANPKDGKPGDDTKPSDNKPADGKPKDNKPDSKKPVVADATGKPSSGKPSTEKPNEGDSDNTNQNTSSDDTDSPEAEPVDLADRPPAKKEMGTGFVPKSPDITARMMAGKKALSDLEQALARLTAEQELGESDESTDLSDFEQLAKGESAKSPSKNSKKRSRNSKSKSSSASSTGRRNGDETNNNSSNNPTSKSGKLGKLDEEVTENSKQSSNSRRGKDATIDPRRFRTEPWFAKLPPELRKAIRANAQSRAPRAYEERLKRYFESID